MSSLSLTKETNLRKIDSFAAAAGQTALSTNRRNWVACSNIITGGIESHRWHRFDSPRKFGPKPKSKIVKMQVMRSAPISIVRYSSRIGIATARGWDFVIPHSRQIRAHCSLFRHRLTRRRLERWCTERWQTSWCDGGVTPHDRARSVIK